MRKVLPAFVEIRHHLKRSVDMLILKQATFMFNTTTSGRPWVPMWRVSPVS